MVYPGSFEEFGLIREGVRGVGEAQGRQTGRAGSEMNARLWSSVFYGTLLRNTACACGVGWGWVMSQKFWTGDCIAGKQPPSLPA